jgi:hypothetical protein
MKKTAMPVIAGILSILAGAANILVAFLLFIGMLVVQGVVGFGAVPFWIPFHFPAVIFLLSCPFMIAGIAAVIGGVFAVQRRKWGLALVGSIAALVPCGILGLVSVILLGTSRYEFEPGPRQIAVTAS